MPPLSHGTPEGHPELETRAQIAELERSTCTEANALMSNVRYLKKSELSGLRAELHHRKPVESESVRYETDEHNGEYAIRAKLVHNGSKKEDTISLLTQVVRDIELPGNEEGDERVAEVSISPWVERVRLKGSMLDDYGVSILDANTQVITPQQHLELAQNVSDTVKLVVENHYEQYVQANAR